MATELSLAPEEEHGIMPAISLALLVLITIAVVVALVNPRETARLKVDNVSFFAPHTEVRAEVYKPGAPTVGEDDLYVVASVHVTDELRLPLFLTNTVMTLTTAEGTVVEASAVSPSYYPRLTKKFPALASILKTQSLYDGDQIDPKTTRDGMVLVMFPGATGAMWQNRKSATLTLNLRNQSPQTVKLP